VLGHCYSIYLRFQGGKAVATGCGAIVRRRLDRVRRRRHRVARDAR
jgi:hypothetical protein